MRLGQTSFVVFASKLVGSALGFVATIYFARELGAAVLGSYALAIALVAWLKLAGNLGVASAMVKRMSEGEEPAAYATASAGLVALLGAILAALVLLFDGSVDAYVGEPVAALVAAILLVGLLESFGYAALRGERKVHVAGLLGPVGTGLRSLFQIGLVVAGFGLVGMLAGHLVGSLLVGLVAISLLSVGLERPTRRHVRSLYEYARYSWLGSLQSRSFNDVDVLLLGVFVQSSLVGVYAAAWSIANFLTLFDSAISTTLFPEISRASAAEEAASVSQMVEQSLAFGGLFLVPGLFGGALLADRLLRIYGPEFVAGTTVLWVLVLATLLYAYQKQLLTALNGLDRPDAAFRINAVFIATNVALNVALISTVGFVGAAVATALSAAFGVALSGYVLRRTIEFRVPVGEIGRQFLAAAVMAGAVRGLETLLEVGTDVEHNFAMVALLVAVGAATYFLTLFGLSARFRATVLANSPVGLPVQQG